MDQSKKTMRHFYCRDVLWETFEQMANDFDCSIDYLVNEAMRYYARSKNYQPPGGPQMTGGNPVPGGPGPGNSGPTKGNGVRAQPGTQPPPNTAGPTSSPAPNRRPQPPTPGYNAANGPAVGPVSRGGPRSEMINGPGGGGMVAHSNHQPHGHSQPAPMPNAGPMAG